MKRSHTQWITYLKENDDAYADFVAFIAERKNVHLSTYDSVSDLKEVHRAQGARAELAMIDRFLTEEEKENYARAERQNRVGK